MRLIQLAKGSWWQGFMEELVAKMVGRGKLLEAARLLSGEGMNQVRQISPLYFF